MRVKIISWNIWKGKNLNGVIEFLAKEKADIVGLQEVTEKESGTKKINLASEIAKKLGYKFIYCKAFTTDRHVPVFDIGNAILSKFEPKNSKCIFLSDINDYRGDSQTEPRGAVKTEFNIDNKNLTVLNVHLSYSDKLRSSDLRMKQTDRLIKLVKDQNTILLGDFNACPESPEVKQISKVIRNADKGSSLSTWSVYPVNYKGFKVDGLKYRIDHIFVSDNIKIEKFSVGSSKASDHLPLIAEMKF